VTLTADQKYRIWTPLKEISPSLVEATLRFEDKYYAEHPGVNPVSLLRATWNLAFSGGTHAGASTITMQVARLRYHLQTRTIAGKLRQIVYALELERHYSKDQILEAYLNFAPYGRNIEGAGAASDQCATTLVFPIAFEGAAGAHLPGGSSRSPPTDRPTFRAADSRIAPRQ
jgi:penicillin-binding protein 1C